MRMDTKEMNSLVALLTDFSQRDSYVGVIKGVVLSLAPRATLVDVSHSVPPQDVLTGAWMLHIAWRYFPEGSIFLCVVDPGVGSERRAVAFQAAGRTFVGPDNGLFSYVLAATKPQRAVSLDNPAYQLPHPSSTFHGRDIFAPAAGNLAAGVALSQLGSQIEPSSLVRVPLPKAEWRAGALIAHVMHIDAFGNAILDVDPAQTDEILRNSAVEAVVGWRRIVQHVRTYAEGPANECALLRDSSGQLAIILRGGSAAQMLHLRRGDEVHITGLRSPI
jgi:S-adenosylmethionine hydrolase